MNWLTATVGIIFIICIFMGIYRGAIKIAVSIATTIITLVLVFLLTPYVSSALSSLTPLDDMIESQVVQTISNVVSGAGDSEDTGITEEGVRKALKAAGVSEEDLNAAGITVGDIVSGNITEEDLGQYGISSSLLDGLRAGGAQAAEVVEGIEIPRDTQIAAIEGADIPQIFKGLLLSNNNSEIYKSLGVDNFVQYVAKYLSKIIINIISFLLIFVIITIILRAIVFALDIIANLPVLGFLNRLAGGVVGAFGALVIVWTIFVAVTLLYTTSIGKETFLMIQETPILKLIYDYNPIMKLATILR